MEIKTSKIWSVITPYLIILFLCFFAVLNVKEGLLINLSVVFLFLLGLFVPGFLLNRIFKLDDANEWLEKFLFYLIAGFIYLLLISLAGILFKFTIYTLVIISIISIIVLFVVALCLDLSAWKENKLRPIFAKFNPKINPLQIFIFAMSVFMLLIITVKGSLFKGGDALYHLSVVRKAFDGQLLSVSGLSYTNAEQTIAYVLPVWHVAIALMARLFSIDIFTLWRDFALALSIISLMTWGWFFKQVFKNNFLAALGFMFFAIFTFNWDAGYIFTTLPIPHTLSHLILLPLTLGLALKFIFGDGGNYRALILLNFLLIFSALIHFSGFFYYLNIMTIFLLGYAVTSFKDENFRKTAVKIVWTIVPSIILMVVLGGLLELTSGVVSSTIKSFNRPIWPKDAKNETFTSWALSARFAYLVLPLTLLFIRKQRSLIFVPIILLVVPITLIEPLRTLILKTVGFLYIKRFYGTVSWYFMVWTLTFGALIIVKDRLLSKIIKKIPNFNYFFYPLLALLIIFLVWLQLSFDTLRLGYYRLFSTGVSTWVNQYYLLIIFCVLVLTLVLWSLKKPRNYSADLPSGQINHWFMASVICATLVLFLWAPIYQKSAFYFKPKNLSRLFSRLNPPSFERYALNYVGGRNTVDFIRKNIPPKSVFDIRGGYFYLPPLVDIRVPVYYSSADRIYLPIYSQKTAIWQKLAIIKKAQIEYLLISDQERKVNATVSSLEAYPQYFQKIYEEKNPKRKTIIYRIISTKLIK